MLTIKELSTWLNIKPSTLYLWAAQGKIPCRKIHGLIRFERQAIEDWLISFEDHHPPSVRSFARSSPRELDDLVEAAKGESYTPRGETKPTAGLIRKEDTDGAV